VEKVVSGQKIAVDEMVFEVVHTPTEIMNESEKPYLCCNINDTSVVYKLHYNNEQTVLLLTDAEGSCSINLLKNHRDQLKCDVVQYGHHGGQSVSKECYAATGAKVSITPQGVHGWFCDGGEAPSQTDLGIRRSLSYMCEQGITPENIYCDITETSLAVGMSKNETESVHISFTAKKDATKAKLTVIGDLNGIELQYFTENYALAHFAVYFSLLEFLFYQ
jgi:hypothetical protein